MLNKITVSLLLLICIQAFAQETTASRQVSYFMTNAPQLNATRKIWIHLPKDYNHSKQRYPVIYMHDGQNLFDAKTAYSGEWNVDEILDSINAKVIVIGIEHGNEKRIDELTPFTNPKYGGGKGDLYLDFLVNTLKPHVDKNYRTESSREHTTIFGSSLGGLTSYYAVLTYPEVFGKVGVFSPSFWYSDEIYTVTENAENIKAKIYFLAGDSESETLVDDVRKMEKIINNERFARHNMTKTVIVKGGQHNEKLWRENFLNAYLWLN